MPRKPKRPCSHPGCPNLTEGRFCEEHAKLVNQNYEKYERDPQSKRRYGRAWKRIRDKYVSLHPFCELCYEKGILVETEEVHHKKKLSDGGTHDSHIYQMMVVDYLILNRDRHGANIEVLRNSRKKTLHLAPLFDHGLSFLCRCMNDSQVEAFDVMEDKLCNNFIGSRSTWENLKLIPADKMPALNPLHESDREIIMEGLDGIISGALQDKIWEMIWKRWCAYEDFCNSR